MNQNRNLGCASAQPLLAAFARKELAGEEASAVRQHVEVCPVCAAHVEFEIRLAERLRGLRHAEVPERLKQHAETILRGRA